MFSIGEDILRDIREERHDLRGIVIASDDISSLGEGYGDSIDRADLLSILCFAGYLCPNMCDFFQYVSSLTMLGTTRVTSNWLCGFWGAVLLASPTVSSCCLVTMTSHRTSSSGLLGWGPERV